MKTVRTARRARDVSVLLAGASLTLGTALPLVGPAAAQSAASSIDQPTPGTLPPGTSTVKGAGTARHEGNGQVAPPSAIQSSTDVMQSGSSVQGRGNGGASDPIKHLPETMR